MSTPRLSVAQLMGFLGRSSGWLLFFFLLTLLFNLLLARNPVDLWVSFAGLSIGWIAGYGARLVQRARARDGSHALRVPLNLES